MNTVHRLGMGVVTLLVPVAASLLAVWIVLNPWYVNFEYRTPNFPDDPFGFTFAERVRYAQIAREYLLNDQGIEFLGDLRFPEGQQAPEISCQFMEDCTRLYNDRELGHMVDVKIVVWGAMRVLIASLGILALLGAWAFWQKMGREYLRALSLGGWLTVPLIGVILLFVIAAFGVIFVFFHEIFFSQGTWTFYTSDTLIRLFPERFWRDTFLMVGGLAAGIGAVIALVARRLARS